MIKDSPNPTEVDYIKRDNELEDSAPFIGFNTHQKLLKLEKFFEGIRQFYEATVKCILEKFPLHDENIYVCQICSFHKEGSR